jgi:hypothetical protein
MKNRTLSGKGVAEAVILIVWGVIGSALPNERSCLRCEEITVVELPNGKNTSEED